METKYNFQQPQITGKSSQTIVFDPKVTGETDELNPSFLQTGSKKDKTNDDIKGSNQTDSK
ncbi:hypothetical protein [Pedobacter sp. V48]|uniref:hypothetical protein n=1 Tax=Pedobacter sp. V48 TaxID=509635 RepID=UPI0004B5C499|nr:hypothetical protein [Pedobacter sp. V48]